MRDDDTEVRRKLRGAAQAHRPDRERMRARVERGMAEGEEPGHRARTRRETGASWLRVVSATAAVAGVFAVAGYGVATALREAGTMPQSVATNTTPRPSAPTPESTHTGTAPAHRPSTPPRTPRRSQPADPPRNPADANGPGRAGSTPPDAPASPAERHKSVPAARLLWADGSIDPGSSTYWSQSDITVKARKPLTELTVEVRVARSDEVADTGNWRSLPAADFDVFVAERDGFLVYRWTLRPGRTVPAGEHVFAGQYNHPAGQRDAGDDTCAVRAATSGERASWRGDFA
ncbi:hypothetical protein [Streptomyces sp. NPDC058308]|uniref:hypothetical protein n=1 Tax=Streptomyces sp. NPDC058308 TaxID=3346440 RepID=UPI0036E31250